mgnify:CR=1 FL=1
MAIHDDALTFSTSLENSRKLKQLFRSFDDDPVQLQAFVDDPTGTALREIYGGALPVIPSDSISDANKLLLSAMSNPKFREWMLDYQSRTVAELGKSEHAGKTLHEIVPREKFLEDVASALISNGDPKLVSSMLVATKNSPVRGEPVVTIDVAVVVAAVAVIVVAITAIDVTPRVINPLYDLTANPQTLRSIAETLTSKGVNIRNTTE